MSTCGCTFDQFFSAFKERFCMPEFPMASGSHVFSHAPDYMNTTGTLVDAHASANTKGSIVELIASTPMNASWVAVGIGSPAYDQNHLVDVMIGGSGSEVVLIPDLQFRSRDFITGYPGQYLFPVFVPAGSRISARCQSAAGFGGVYIRTHLIAGSLMSCGSAMVVDAYGAIANSIGTNVDPGGTAHTKSGWVEIAAATNRTHNWLTMSVSNNDETMGASWWLIDVGIGGSGSEVVLIPDVSIEAGSTTDMSAPSVFNFPLSVPVGSRLSVRAQCSRNTDGDRDLFVKLYGT